MGMPPPCGSDEKNESGEQERDDQREFREIIRSETAVLGLDIKGERKHRSNEEYQNEKDKDRPADPHAEIGNTSTLR